MLRTLTSGRDVRVGGSGSDEIPVSCGGVSPEEAGAQRACGAEDAAGVEPGEAGGSAGGAGVGGAGVGAGGSGELAVAKASMRAGVLAVRRAMAVAQRAEAGRSLRDAVLELPETQMAGTVAAYISVGTEPGTRGLVFALWKRGTYVLLPLLRPDGDLDWASYEGPESLAPGPRGLLEPTEPARGVTSVTSADLVIVPALAADRRGNRLGRGGGSYDRALARVGSGILTVALLYDDELRSEVPAGLLDQRVRAVALPGEGIIKLR